MAPLVREGNPSSARGHVSHLARRHKRHRQREYKYPKQQERQNLTSLPPETPRFQADASRGGGPVKFFQRRSVTYLREFWIVGCMELYISQLAVGKCSSLRQATIFLGFDVSATPARRQLLASCSKIPGRRSSLFPHVPMARTNKLAVVRCRVAAQTVRPVNRS